MPSKRRNVTATTAPTNHTPFRKMERLFKKELDKSQLVDFDDNSQAVLGFPGCYSFPTLPGVHLLKNHLSIETQISLAEQCLTDWSKWPNLSSTDAHFLLPTEGIWNAFCTDPDRLIEPRTFDKHEPQVGEAITVDPPTDPMHKQKSTPVSKVLNRMRWTTLGYQYNWTAKEYFLDRSPPFPEQVASCVTDILCKIEHLTGFDGKLYRAEAGIINYYHVLHANSAR